MSELDMETIAHERFEAWNEIIDRKLMPLRIHTVESHPFHLEIGAREIHELAVTSVSGAGCNVLRGRNEIARSLEHFYLVTTHLGGEASVMSRGVETHLTRGDVFVIDTTREVRLSLVRPYQHLLAKIPKRWLDARLPRHELLGGSVLSHDNPLTRLYAGYLSAGFQMAGKLPSSTATMFSTHLLDLLCEAFADKQSASSASVEARLSALFVRACRLISLHYNDPALAPDRIAGKLGVSARTLHRAFEAHGETAMQYVLKERVKFAATALRSPESRNRTITEIAFSSGFNDVSHFGRVFRTQMGSTPSEWRLS